MMQPRNKPSTLLPHHGAFVIQFQTDTEIEVGDLSGRIEHVVSGRATHFESLERLLAFIGLVIRDYRTASADQETG